MKVEKFKVLLYLKKSGLDKFGKAPIMGRITVNNTMAQFSCKLSCTPELWNPRESRLNGKSKEAVDINAKIDRLLLSVNSAFDSLVERKIDFDAVAVKELLQGSVETQMTLLKRLDMHIEDMRSRIGIDVAKTSMSTYVYTRRYLGEYIQKRFKTCDVAFGQLNEHIPWEFQDYILKDKGLAVDTARHYLAAERKEDMNMELLTKKLFEQWMETILERLERQDEMLLALKAPENGNTRRTGYGSLTTRTCACCSR